MTMSESHFSVYQFFQDGSYERVRYHVPVDEAMRAAKHYTESIGARLGSTRRVIITDAGDFTNFDWRYGEGIVYPTRAEGATFPGAKNTPPGEWDYKANLKLYGGGLGFADRKDHKP